MQIIDLYNFSRLIFPPITIALFLIGLILQFTKWFSMGLPATTFRSAKRNKIASALKAWTWDYMPTQYLPLRYEPVFRVNGFIFHITLLLLVLTPIHQAFLFSFFGSSGSFGFATYGLARAVISTVFVVSGILILCRWIIQYSSKKSLARPIASPGDFIGIALILLIALTGILAAYGLLYYILMVTLHFIFIQLFVIYLPFSKTIHVISGLVARTYYGIRRATIGV